MVNYPNGQPSRTAVSRTQQKRQTIYGSRGMSLEERINQSNAYYLQRGIAVIHKKPTPVQVVKVDFPKRSAAKITEAYYRHASTTDYNGIYKGFYIDFEAKETTNKTRFPLANLATHQIQHMRQCHQQGGIVFLIIAFSALQCVYLLPFAAFESFIQTHQQKSLPLSYLETHALKCQEGVFPLIDYLPAVDWMIANR